MRSEAFSNLSMNEGIGALLFGCGVQCVALAAALWFSGFGSPANRRLALALLVLSGMMSVYVLGWTGRAEAPSWLAFLPLNLPLALGPLLYAYVRRLATGRDFARPLLHFAPAAASVIYCTVVLALPQAERAAFKAAVHDVIIKPLFEAAVLASLAAYGVAGLNTLHDYRRWLARERSDADRHGATWIGRILISLLATLSALALVRAYTWLIGELEVGPLYVWFGVWGVWLGVEGWRTAERRYPVMGANVTAGSAPASADMDWAGLGARWRNETQIAGWWREPELTLGDLARRLGTNTNYLSRAINDGIDVNFNEMINRMRAMEVARLIEAGEVENLLQAAHDAGFSSKATFNRAFRAVYGHSPSVHRLKSRNSGLRVDFEASEGDGALQSGATKEAQ